MIRIEIRIGEQAMKENYVYPIRIEEVEGKLAIRFLDFPEIIAEADSRETAISVAQETLALTIIDYENAHIPFPEPTTTESDIIFIHIWMPYFRNMTKEVYVKKSVTIPQWLDILAKNNSINFSAALVKGIKSDLGIED